MAEVARDQRHACRQSALQKRRIVRVRQATHRAGCRCFHPIGHNDQINLDLIRLVGADRVVLGSDYCFDMGLTDPVGTVQRLGALTDSERRLILGKTAQALLRLT